MFYRISRLLFRFYFSILRRWEVSGRENMPEKGGVVIVSNHSSNLDPLIVGCSFKRYVNTMGKEELFKINPLVTWVIKHLGTFPIKRGQMDRSAIRFSINHLKAGNIIALFPEGTRSKSGELQDARNGAAMLAIKAGVPILPIGIIGSKGRGKIVVKIGKPIDTYLFSGDKVNKEAMGKVSEQFMKEIAKLLNND